MHQIKSFMSFTTRLSKSQTSSIISKLQVIANRDRVLRAQNVWLWLTLYILNVFKLKVSPSHHGTGYVYVGYVWGAL